jgi:hypothetical protein
MQYAYFDRFTVAMSKRTALACSQSCTNNSASVANTIVTDPALHRRLSCLTPQEVAAELTEQGTWSKKELRCHQRNIDRIIWIAACYIRDGLQCDNLI